MKLRVFGSAPSLLRASRRPSRVRQVAAASLLATAALVLGLPPLAGAQAPPQVTGPESDVPPVPEGDATIRGRIVLPGDPAGGADLPVALYALRADGRPGLTGTRTDAEGRFVFERVSNDPNTVYLVGTQYLDVPFGQRVVFEPGQTDFDVALPLREISADASAVLFVATTYKLDWVGAQLFVQVSHQIRSAGDAVVFVPEEARAGQRPVLSANLPGGVVEFVDGQGGLGEGLVRDGDTLSFWGPLYPGDQEVRYGFVLDAPPSLEPAEAGEAPEASRTFALSWPLPTGSGEVQILTPASDPRPRGAGLRELGEPSEIEGTAYVRSSLGSRSPGETIDVTLDIPASSTDASGLRITRADYWIDFDDTAMRVTVELNLEVGGGSRLMASGDEPLLHFAFPDGAEFQGLSGAAQATGVGPGADGGLVVRGPLPPGTSVLGFRYRVPVRDGLARLDLAFERPVDLLNVLVADTGVVVESTRLHKRRPFRSGTRTYLHREAFQIDPNERVAIAFLPFERTEMPRPLSAAVVIAIAAGLAAFLIVPLRRARRAASDAAPPVSELASEREAIYEALRDLDFDHETGKVDDADHERIRGELRATAVALLRREREEADAPAAHGDAASEATGEVRCPGCGTPTRPDWRFCSDCGERLEAAEESA